VRPKAILFDMDGTITEPLLDFPRIKAEMGIGSRPILEALAAMDHHERAHAEAVLRWHECEASSRSMLNRGCMELMEWVDRCRIGKAIITRNSRASVETVLAKHGLRFDVLVTREDDKYKPDPEPLLRACARLDVTPDEAWMVGDGQYDVEAGLAAGVRTVWVSHGQAKPFDARPWRVVRDLVELTGVLEDCLVQK
jgi:HAD superfamily hydrolase (TIGR01509 family)